MKHKNKAVVASDERKRVPGAADAEATGANRSDPAADIALQEAESKKASAKAKKTSGKKKKQEEAALDTSALLKKKDLRDH